MKFLCSPKIGLISPDELPVVLYAQADDEEYGSAGAALAERIRLRRLVPTPRAWDFLSLAMSVVAADCAGHRNQSPDGWTREFELKVAVTDADFWNSQSSSVEAALAFLTTDLWRITFIPGGFVPGVIKKPEHPEQDCVALLSGGLDSLVGVIDLDADGHSPFTVSHTVRGDASHQVSFAQQIGSGLAHIALNHNAKVPDPEKPLSQRARSMAFLAYGVLVATSLQAYGAGDEVPLYICENGFISVNPPLTPARVGSLSTRTTHPAFLATVQGILDAASLRVSLKNPYQLTTKGEMLLSCSNQELLKKLAFSSTSCGRFQNWGYKHCGRCVPCQIRRAAFVAWGNGDTTAYVFEKLGKSDENHAAFDDVRSTATAILEAREVGVERWLAGALNSAVLGDVTNLKAMVARGLTELEGLHKRYSVK